MKKKLAVGTQLDINAAFNNGVVDESVVYFIPPVDQRNIISVTPEGIVSALQEGTATVQVKDVTTGARLRPIVFQVLSEAKFAAQNNLDGGSKHLSVSIEPVAPAGESPLIPALTALQQDGFTVSASANVSNPLSLFDNSNETYCTFGNGDQLALVLPSASTVSKIVLTNEPTPAAKPGPATVKVYGSSDTTNGTDGTWVQIVEATCRWNNGVAEISFPSPETYIGWRIDPWMPSGFGYIGPEGVFLPGSLSKWSIFGTAPSGPPANPISNVQIAIIDNGDGFDNRGLTVTWDDSVNTNEKNIYYIDIKNAAGDVVSSMQYRDYGGNSSYLDFEGRVEPGTYTAVVATSSTYTLDNVVYNFDPVESTASAAMTSAEVTSTTYYVPTNPVAQTQRSLVSPLITITGYSSLGQPPYAGQDLANNLVLFDPAVAGAANGAIVDGNWGGGEVFGGSYQDNAQYGPWNAFDFSFTRFQYGTQNGFIARAAENIHMFHSDPSDTEWNVLGFISPFPRVVTSITVGSIDPASPDNIVPNNYTSTSRNFKLQGSNDTQNGIDGTWVDMQQAGLGVWAIGGVWGDQTFTIWLPNTGFSQVNNVAYKAHRLVSTDGTPLCFAKTLFFGYH